MAVLTSFKRTPASGCFKALLGALLASSSLLFWCDFAVGAQTTKEYQVKAACLFNFAQFVEWPAATFANPKAPIIIGVLGDDPFGPALEQIVRGETINDRKLVVARSRSLEELKSCHLLFISKSEKGNLDQILSSLNAASILTISETDQFARRGGVINFFLESNKVRFEINAEAARRNGLKISSQLLKLGKVVGSEPRKEKG